MAEASAAGVQAGDSTYLAGHKIQDARMNRGLAQLSTPSTGADSYTHTGPDILLHSRQTIGARSRLPESVSIFETALPSFSIFLEGATQAPVDL